MIRIARAGPPWLEAWAAMRADLWPDEDAAELAREAQAWDRDPADGDHIWLAFDEETPVGFAEASVRRDYVNGCDTTPVGFLEGIYVAPGHRRRGVARALVDTVAAWARAEGLAELASDALLDNRTSHAMHRALGFDETERVVYFRRMLVR